jgi:hypothetical protein
VSRETVHTSLERWLREDEEERLLAAAPSWLREILIFALSTGLRQGEILDLQWPMVDLGRKTLTLAEQKNQAIDTLPLNRTAVEVLTKRAAVRHRGHPFVFGSWNGTKRIARFTTPVDTPRLNSFGSMTRGIPLPPGWSNAGWISTRSKNWDGGNPWSWSCGMPTTMSKRCGPGWSGWIRQTEKLAQI